jgi:hypothetical protein
MGGLTPLPRTETGGRLIAESYLTPALFRQILGRINRTTRCPT